MVATWMLFGLGALFLYGLAAVAQKLSTNHTSAERSFLWFAAAFVVIGVAVILMHPVNWSVPGRTWFWTVSGGALNMLGSLASFAAYRSGGKASVVTPLAALYPVVTILLAVPLFNEGLSAREVGGIVLALLSALALSYEGNPKAGPDMEPGKSSPKTAC